MGKNKSTKIKKMRKLFRYSRKKRTKKRTKNKTNKWGGEKFTYLDYFPYLSGPSQLIIMQKDNRIAILIGETHKNYSYCNKEKIELFETLFSFLKKVFDIYEQNKKRVNILLENIDSQSHHSMPSSNTKSIQNKPIEESDNIYEYEPSTELLETITAYTHDIERQYKYIKYKPLEFRRRIIAAYGLRTKEETQKSIKLLVERYNLQNKIDDMISTYPELKNYEYILDKENDIFQIILEKIYALLQVYALDQLALNYIQDPEHKSNILITGSLHTKNIYEILKSNGWSVPFQVGSFDFADPDIMAVKRSGVFLPQCLNITNFFNILAQLLHITLPNPHPRIEDHF